MASYDAAASSFDRHRALPDGVPEAIRTAILGPIDASSQPRILDLGAGTGRIGRAFAAANDNYIGLDLSFGMLHEFVRHTRANNRHMLNLVQADGEHLPFHDATFDVVMLIQVIGAARNWEQLVIEARRVLTVEGALVFGHLVMPADGLDARMKKCLASLLEEMGVQPYHMNGVSDCLRSLPESGVRIIAAEWSAKRTPGAFLDRQPTGARFSRLPEGLREDAREKLRAWALTTFGSLDAEFEETHHFELRVFKFEESDL